MIRRRDDADGSANVGGSHIDRTEATMADNGEVTIVGAGARLEGNVVSAGNLRIDGQVKGQINAEGDVALAPQSQVEADIRAQNVSVAGRFKGNREAWKFFTAQPPGYQKLATFYVMSAKQEDTRLRRLDQLIKLSSEGKRLR